jgi:AcrR family transcriptional regulator
VAQHLGYTSPLLYEHFRDKQELLTEIAIGGHAALAREISTGLPANPSSAILSMVERYWSFMQENEQLYRLMNGMDGAVIERERVTALAQRTFEPATAIVQAWLMAACRCDSGADLLFEDLWAVLHGMALLHLDRSVPFDVRRAKDCVLRVLIGTRQQARRVHK